MTAVHSELTIKIGGRILGGNQPCFITAEAGFNHNGQFRLAKKLIHAARECGADAIKFQTFRADRLVSKTARVYGVRDAQLPRRQVDLYRQYELSDQDHRRIKQEAKKKKIIFFSTPFDETSADFLEALDVPAFKIASCDLTHISLIRHVARKKRPMILSCGMARFDEIRQALHAVFRTGNRRVILLHCTSSYPCRHRDVNLRKMTALREKFRVPVGLSDHTSDNYAAFAAAAMGAVMIEKHFTLNRRMSGVDHYFSAEPKQLADLVTGIRAIALAKGRAADGPVQSERQAFRLARRSLVAACDIAKGERLRTELITIKRPGTGIPPNALNDACRCRAKTAIRAEQVIRWNMLKRTSSLRSVT